MRKYTGGVLQSMLSFTIVLFAHRSNYSFCRKRLLSLVFGAFLLDLLCCHTTLSANQRLTAGTYTAEFDYDVMGTLAAARYDEVDILYKLPDRIGNIYPDRFGKEATYERGGRRKEDKEWTYHFDGEGFLTQRVSKTESIERYDWIRRKLLVEPLIWTYEWDGTGQLVRVKNNKKVNLRFEYDALGRRVAKINEYVKAEGHKITRFLWDGNVPLHEWSYPLNDRPETIDDSDGRRSYASPESQTELMTWIFDEGTFVPSAKLVGERRYSIISDYLGTPIEAYDEEGKRVWARELDIYGRTRSEEGEAGFIPFLYQGQYLDTETGLAYNRFCYYSPETGAYISQDPIHLEAGLTNLYAYIHDVNALVDPWGLRSFTQAVGYIGEKYAQDLLKKQGVDLVDAKYGSNNGIDILAKNPTTGKYDVFEVKSSTVGMFRLSPTQQDTENFIKDRLRLAKRHGKITSKQLEDILANLGDFKVMHVTIQRGAKGRLYAASYTEHKWH